MLNTFKNNLLKILICFVMFCNFATFVHAAEFYASASTESVAPGGTFSVTVGGLSDLRGRFSVSVSNGSATVDSFFATGNDVTTITVTAGSADSVYVQVSTVDVTKFSTDAEVSGTTGVSVTITSSSTGGQVPPNVPTDTTPPIENPTQPNNNDNSTSTPKSSNNSLSALSVSTGTLSPEFNADTTEYTVTLPADATGISINASAQDGKATVSGTGDHSVKAGLNEFIINVTAENGAGKNYFVRVNVDEAPLVHTTYNNQKLGVVRNTDEVGIPSNFEETKVTIDGQEVKAWHSNLLNKTIVYLVNDAGEKNFYIYEDGKISSVFKSMSILGKNIYLVDVPEAMKTMTGFSFGEVEIDGKKLPGWTFTDARFANYMLIYVMDEQGNMKLYQYEKTENSLQLYSGAAAISQDVYESTLKDAKSKTDTQQIIIYILVATTIIGVGAAGFAFYQWMQVRKLGTTTYRKKFDYSSDEEKSIDDEK